MAEDFFLTNPGTQIISILVGIVVLTLGRKLFWLAVGVVGFILGLSLIVRYMSGQPDWVILITALVAGGIGALLAILVQKVAAGIAGFLLGGYIAVWLLQLFELNLNQWAWLFFIVGGIIGIILALSLLELALIVLSSLAGATLIVQAIPFSSLVAGLLFLALLIVGIVIQARMLPEES
jgi:hypothetical protein